MFSPSEVLLVKAISLAVAPISFPVLHLQVLLFVGGELGATLTGAVQAVGQALLDGLGREGADRVQRG